MGWLSKQAKYKSTVTTITTSYYLGDRLIAQREGTTLRYVHQDHLSGTSVMSDSSGALISGVKFSAFGETLSGSVPTDKLFTGQRKDGTGLYYYGARYYDPGIGRFLSADTVVPQNPQAGNEIIGTLTVSSSGPIPRPLNTNQGQSQMNYDPQCLNRYSYVLNNPLKYVDSNGQNPIGAIVGAIGWFVAYTVLGAMVGLTVFNVQAIFTRPSMYDPQTTKDALRYALSGAVAIDVYPLALKLCKSPTGASMLTQAVVDIAVALAFNERVDIKQVLTNMLLAGLTAPLAKSFVNQINKLFPNLFSSGGEDLKLTEQMLDYIINDVAQSIYESGDGVGSGATGDW